MRRRMRPPKTTKCPECGGKTIVAEPRTGELMFLNPVPTRTGGIVLGANHYEPGVMPRCRILTGLERLQHEANGNPVKRYRLHTCTHEVEETRYDELLRAVNAFMRDARKGAI